MPLITSPTLIRSFALVHLTTAYYLLVSPAKIVNHGFVAVLGASMGLPPIPLTSTLTTSPTTSLASALLTLLALTDLSATSLPEEIYSYYWSSQSPIRLLFFFILTAISYLAKPGGLNLNATGKPGFSAPRPADVFMGDLGEGVGNIGGGVGGGNTGGSGMGGDTGGLSALSNGLVFTWGFVEMVWWFWVFVTLRDERREMSARKAAERERKREEDMLLR
ncbi:hypothetical protein MMC30_009276 [Trapelia coarctata]|nr:hypothetical protein [Trapelia coarctata]